MASPNLIDIQAHPPSHGMVSQVKKTLIGGVIGLIFILLTLGLVIFKGISVINRSQIIL
jgi:hypothetical protein